MLKSEDKISTYQIIALILAALTLLSLSMGDALIWHRGFSAVDEAAEVANAWELFHGGLLSASLGTGFWNCVPLAISQCLIGAHLIALYLPGLLWLSLEMALLWRFTARTFDKQSAWGALMLNMLCVFSFARTRSLLSYTEFPCELLGVLELAHMDSFPSAFAAGLIAGLGALDYEAWIPSGWPVLVTALVGIVKPKRHSSHVGLLAGFILGTGITLALSWKNLQSYWILRTQFSLHLHLGSQGHWGQNLRSLFLGSDVLPGFGSAKNYPNLAPWAWPFLAWGAVEAWRHCKTLLLWVSFGFLLLLPPAAGFNEFQRSVAAWPALCIIAGLGLRAARKQWGNFRWFPACLIAWIALGTGFEAHAFLASQDQYSSDYYGLSRAELEAAQWIHTQKPVHLLSNLGMDRAADFEWMCSGSLDAQGKPIAFLLWEQLPALGNPPPVLHAFRDPDGVQEVYLLELAAPWDTRLLSAEGYLSHFWNAQPRYDHLQLLENIADALHDPHMTHPWVRTELWERRMMEAVPMDRVDDVLIHELRKEPLLHAGPLYHPAQYLRQNNMSLAIELHAQALRIDPRLVTYEAFRRNEGLHK